MKLDQNICIVPHCEKTKFIVDIDYSFCTEHLEKFLNNFLLKHNVPSEIKTDEELRKKFLNDMVYDFFDEEAEYHRKKHHYQLKKKKKKRK